ncbi:hypothetical protein BU16DRAFT_589868 [Lophium mytilinum]|uniref:C2H2-type domain-containing protein n=1 Tax=Lophium mytilinum TaxID=390894 RepID=A0A6A6QRE7_9PEZI|nr:hypothetical protein BU16DRAFT_589868 [Lophium mytilinum]
MAPFSGLSTPPPAATTSSISEFVSTSPSAESSTCYNLDAELLASPRQDRPPTSAPSASPSQRTCPLVSPSRCSECGMAFEKPCLLRKHFHRIHNKRYRCTIPGCQQKPFGLRADLVRHEKSRHGEQSAQETFNCPFANCQSAPFRRNDNLKRHMRAKHPSSFPSSRSPTVL